MVEIDEREYALLYLSRQGDYLEMMLDCRCADLYYLFRKPDGVVMWLESDYYVFYPEALVQAGNRASLGGTIADLTES